MIIEEDASAAQLAKIRELFLEYAASLEISLCFQNFETELASLPAAYYANPSESVVFMELALEQTGASLSTHELGR